MLMALHFTSDPYVYVLLRPNQRNFIIKSVQNKFKSKIKTGTKSRKEVVNLWCIHNFNLFYLQKLQELIVLEELYKFIKEWRHSELMHFILMKKTVTVITFVVWTKTLFRSISPTNTILPMTHVFFYLNYF